MPAFAPNQTIETREPHVVVDAGLQPGAHRFRLVVVNERGVRSLPAEKVVMVIRLPGPPIADPRPPGPPVPPIPTPPPVRPIGGGTSPRRPGGGSP